MSASMKLVFETPKENIIKNLQVISKAISEFQLDKTKEAFNAYLTENNIQPSEMNVRMFISKINAAAGNKVWQMRTETYTSDFEVFSIMFTVNGEQRTLSVHVNNYDDIADETTSNNKIFMSLGSNDLAGEVMSLLMDTLKPLGNLWFMDEAVSDDYAKVA